MRVLFTAIGTLSNSYLISHSKKKYDWYVVGTDSNSASLVPSSLLVDRFYQVESVDNIEVYMSQLIKIIIDESINYLFPVIDEEVSEIAKRINEFRGIGVTPILSSYESIEFVRNKYNLYNFIKDFYPNLFIKTFKYDNFHGEIPYPLHLKPNYGRASLNTFIINSRTDLESLSNINYESQLIIQEFIVGEIVSIDCYIDHDTNQQYTISRLELLRNSNGASQVCRIISNPYLETISLKIAKEIGLSGLVNFEYFDLGSSSYRLIEINPRVPAGIAFSIASGFDYIDMVLKSIGYIDEYKNSMEIETIFARSFNIIRMK
jgi:carbamoyl-phosphate synthase large subunit